MVAAPEQDRAAPVRGGRRSDVVARFERRRGLTPAVLVGTNGGLNRSAHQRGDDALWEVTRRTAVNDLLNLGAHLLTRAPPFARLG